MPENVRDLALGQATVHKLEGCSDPELVEEIGVRDAQAVRERTAEGCVGQVTREAGD